jgi:hypothetical protein
MWMHSTGIGTTAPVNNASDACLLRSPFVHVKNFDDMPITRLMDNVDEIYALRVEKDKRNRLIGLPWTT